MSASAQRNAAIERFSPLRLERVFTDCFCASHRTQLTGGAEEPLYEPATTGRAWNVIHYRADYFASALHEVAHWCIAGTQRRAQLDYGYWYNADGRNANQQQAFEAVEYKPQALEWFFAKACGWRFNVSTDNLNASGDLQDKLQDDPQEIIAFTTRILVQARHWQAAGLPRRADTFYRALCAEFGTFTKPEALAFNIAELT